MSNVRSIRRVALAWGLAALGIAIAGNTWAQSAAPAPWPQRPIRLVSPFNPGGAIDVLNRVIAEKLSTRLGQQVYVDAIPGAVPSNARLASFLPFEWLLPRVDVLVTNGGYGSLNQALRVPQAANMPRVLMQ